MPIHWTEFPARVEKFGDLFSILETLDRDNTDDVFTGNSFRNESDSSAYAVDLHPAGYHFLPRAERILGWTELATYTEREYHSSPTLVSLRAVRGVASEILDVPIRTVDEMSIIDVVSALDESRRQPAPLAVAGDYLHAEYRWLKVGQVAQVFALSASEVSKLATTGTFVTNGKTGHDRRIDVLSVVKRELERLNRSEADSAAP